MNVSKGDFKDVNEFMYLAAHDIRFIDSNYNTLFFLPSGSDIQIIRANGDKTTATCFYVDAYHVKVNHNIFHICEFAERMETLGNIYCPITTPLPPYSYDVLKDDPCQIIEISRYQDGYQLAKFVPDNAKKLAELMNKGNGVTKSQAAAMLWGSMYGWECPEAFPDAYDDEGNPRVVNSKE